MYQPQTPSTPSTSTSKLKRMGLLLVIVLALASVGYVWYRRGQNTTAATNITTQAEEREVAQALATKDVGEAVTFSLPSKEDEGAVSYRVEKAELFDEVVINGKKAKAVTGRQFFILTVKIDNPTSTTFKINTRDYVRLAVGDTEEWLAPEVHNDPVEVQAISTKYTRVGFPVDVQQRNFKVRIGEITGEKRTIDISL